MLRDYVIVGAGGGGSRFGLKNAIISFKYDPVNGFGNAVQSLDFDSIPIYIDSLDNLKLFCTCADATTYVYELSDDGTFREAFSFLANDFSDKQFVYQTICKFVRDKICTGMTDGNLK